MRTKTFLSSLMQEAWTLVKTYGFTMRDALKQAWLLAKLNIEMRKGIVKFMYEKLNGEIRTAWGTLKSELIPETGSDNRTKNNSVAVYFDEEKQSWRCFKKANLLKIA